MGRPAPNLVDPVGWPKIGLLNRVLGAFLGFVFGKVAKHRIHQIFFSPTFTIVEFAIRTCSVLLTLK